MFQANIQYRSFGPLRDDFTPLTTKHTWSRTYAMDFFHEYGGDPLKPSLFELVAQEQLRDLLQPALKYVLSVWLITITGRTAEP